MICSKCGKTVSNGQAFCTNCGSPVNTVGQQMQTPQGQPNMYYRQAPQGQQSVNYQQAPQGQQSMNYQQAPQGQQSMYYQQPMQGVQYGYGQPQKPKKKTGLILGIVGGVVAVIVIALIALFKLGSEDDNMADADITPAPATTSVSEPEVVPTDVAGNKTVMIYMIGSNLESEGGAGSDDLWEMMKADIGENTNIVIQTGGCTDWSDSSIADGSVERFYIENDSLHEIEDLGTISMVETDTLTDFIEFAAEEYPADQYYLVMWDHGGGIPVSFGYDELFPDDMLDFDEISYALGEAGVHFDAVLMDACNMCSLETAMALKDYADYMVAAESYVMGKGLYYSGWLAELSKDDADNTVSACKVAADEYMAALDNAGTVGSISVIDLSKIDALNEAYGNFLAEINAADYNELSTYVSARGNGGDYGSELVDIISFASLCKNSSTNALKQAVTDATLYTKSDFAFGQGMTVYAPSYEYYDYYDEERALLFDIGYSDKTLDFYDSLCSAFIGINGDSASGLSWFKSDVAAVYGDYTPGGDASDDVYVAGSGGVYDLEVTDYGTYQAIDLTDDDWDIISDYSVSFFLYDDEYIYEMGTENFGIEIDGNSIIAGRPQNWTSCQGSYVAFYSQSDFYNGPDDWAQIGYVPAIYEDEEIFLVVYNDPENLCVVTGAMLADFDTMEVIDDTQYTLDGDEEVQLVVKEYDMNTEDWDLLYMTDLLRIDELDLTYESHDYSDNCALKYSVFDIYDNEYITDLIVVD